MFRRFWSTRNFQHGKCRLIVPEQAVKRTKWQVVTRFRPSGFTSFLCISVFPSRKLFPAHEPTQAEMELRAKANGHAAPAGDTGIVKPSPRPAGPPPPRVHVDPRVLREALRVGPDSTFCFGTGATIFRTSGCAQCRRRIMTRPRSNFPQHARIDMDPGRRRSSRARRGL